MNQPLTDGPRPPESVPSPPEQRVNRLVPFVHVEDVERSIAFYYHLGFIVESVYKYKGRPVWATSSLSGAAFGKRSQPTATVLACLRRFRADGPLRPVASGSNQGGP